MIGTNRSGSTNRLKSESVLLQILSTEMSFCACCVWLRSSIVRSERIVGL